MENNDEPAESDERFPNKLPKYLRLVGGLGYMRLRKTPAVIRYHNSTKKEGHEQQYSELVLFTNWRDEKKEFNPDFLMGGGHQEQKRLIQISPMSKIFRQ